MKIEEMALIAAGIIVFLIISALVYRKLPKKLKVDKFSYQWQELQACCKDRKLWPYALSEAEKLLHRALKKRKYKGKTMGERMVSAQKIFTDNDGVWFAHNLYKKVIVGDIKRLNEDDIKDALIAYRQALRDLGALKK